MSGLGTVFVELDLQYDQFNKKLDRVKQDASVVTLETEKNFQNLGLKSAQHFEYLRAKAENAYQGILHSASSTATDIIRAEKAKNEQLERLNEQQFGKQTSLLTQLKSNWMGVTAVIAGAGGAIYAIKSAGEEIINAGMAAQKMDLSLKAATGTTEAATAAQKYLASESERLGLLFEAQVGGYVKIAAASKNTTLEGQATRDIWRAIATAGAALQMSNEDVSGSLMAVSQMISKGKVSAEELRQQLGERLPGALHIAARAMGVSTEALDDMLKKGQVYAEDFLPKFARALEEQYGQAAIDASNSATAATNKYHNVLRELKVTLSEHVLPLYTKFLELSANAIKNVASPSAMAQMVGGGSIMVDEFGRPIVANVQPQNNNWWPMEPSPAGFTNPTNLDAHIQAWKEWNDQAKEREKILKKLEDAEEKHYKAAMHQIEYMQKAQDKADEETYKNAIRERDELNKIRDGLLKEEEKRIRDEKKLAKDKADAYKEMYGILAKYGKEYTEEDMRLQEQALAERFLKLGELTGNYALAMEAFGELNEELWKKQALATGGFFDGIKVGLMETAEETASWANTSYSVYQQFTKDVKAELSDNLFSALKGDFDSFQLNWEKLWDSMLKTMTDKVADMVVKAGANFLLDVGGKALSWAGSLLKFHEGAWDVQSPTGGEFLGLLQGGEMVIPTNIAENLRKVWVAGSQAAALSASEYSTFLEGLSTAAENMPGAYGLTSQAYVGATVPASYSSIVAAAEAAELGALTASEAAAGASTGAVAGTAFGNIAGAVGVVLGPIMTGLGQRSSERRARHAFEDWWNTLPVWYRQYLNDETYKTMAWQDPLKGFYGQTTTDPLTGQSMHAVDMTEWHPGYADYMRYSDVSRQPGWMKPNTEFAYPSWLFDNVHSLYQAMNNPANWRPSTKYDSAFTLGSFGSGTGPEGLPYTGPFMGHKGEIVLNPRESEAVRKGGGGTVIKINSPIYLDGKIVGHFKKEVRAIADDVRVNAERRVMGSKRCYYGERFN
ncbi:MAG: hypothetical protein C4576_19740 [Desulfobacteraceae bacterium]|nr:MAG: hypothetical protein C4576_19740 [Desulfobacteraceae bacterium]